jgi:NADPH:quinone reductase-like Zn-dependent oxidoreductase
MKAYQYRMGEPISALRIVDLPMPSVGPGQVLVKMHAAALNFRDLLVVTGQFPRAQQEVIIPLCDGAGEVVEVAGDVTTLKVGDRVTPLYNQRWMAGEMQDSDTAWSLGGCIDGVAAEYRVFGEMGVLRFPDHLSYAEAATLPCAGVTVWNALHGPRPLAAGDTMLTLGTGGVSIHALQMAHAAGAEVIITSSSDAKLERAKALGADQVINYATNPDWDVAVRAITGGRGVDHVIENGGGGTLLRSIRSTRRGGWIHIIGLIAPGEIDPVHILLSGVTVRGQEVGSRAMFAAMNRSLAHSKIKPVVDKVFAFDQLPAALGALGEGRHFGKLVLAIV